MPFDTSVPPPALPQLRPMPQQESPLETLAQMGEIRARNQQMQSNSLEIQQRQMDLQDAQTMRQAFQESGGDWDKAYQLMSQRGVQPKTLAGINSTILGNKEKQATTTKALADAQEAQSRAAEAERDFFGSMGVGAQNANYSPAVVDAMLLQAEKTSPTYAPHIEQVRQLIAQNPDNIKTVIDGLVTSSKAATTMKREQESADITNKKNQADTALIQAQTPGAQAKSDLEVASAAGLKTMTDADWQQRLDSTVTDKTSPLYKRTAAAVDFYRKKGDLNGAANAIKDAGDQLGKTETAVRTAEATKPVKIDIANATQNAAANAAESNGGLDLMAEQALNGQFNSRNPMLTAKVYGRAAELAKERGMSNQQVLMERNAAKANQGALDSLTKQYETLKPFEDMALKNSTILEQKSQAVSNLGAPFLNTPVRQLQSRFAGDTNVTAFVAAMQPVQADFARILNSPNAGGVLSDDARHEMQLAISPGATPGQIKSALDVFRTDAANRHATYDAAVKDLQGRTIVGNATKPSENAQGGTKYPPLPATLGQSDVGKVYVSPKTGKAMKITAVNPANPKQFKSSEVQ